MRNYVSNAIVKRVSLLHFPTCFAIADFNSISTDHEDEDLGGEQVLALIGTREGKVLTYKISSSGNVKLSETRGGLCYGGIAAIDVSVSLAKLVATSDSGEMFTADLIAEST